MIFLKNSDYYKEIFFSLIRLYRRNLTAIVLASIFIFFVVWTSSVISVITSRKILEPLTVKINGVDDWSAVHVMANLSRSGNTIHLNGVEGTNNEWYNPNDTFINKIIVGIRNDREKKLSSVTITPSVS